VKNGPARRMKRRRKPPCSPPFNRAGAASGEAALCCTGAFLSNEGGWGSNGVNAPSATPVPPSHGSPPGTPPPKAADRAQPSAKQRRRRGRRLGSPGLCRRGSWSSRCFRRPCESRDPVLSDVPWALGPCFRRGDDLKELNSPQSTRASARADRNAPTAPTPPSSCCAAHIAGCRRGGSIRPRRACRCGTAA
jgi:hypothetical protein